MSFTLGLDLDGVVADYEKAFRTYVAKKRGVPEYSLSPLKSWSYVDNGWVETEDEFLQLHADAVRAGLFRKMDALPGASDRLWDLSDAGVYIRVITHRLCVNGVHAGAAGDTVAFLEDKNIPYRDLCFVENKPEVQADVYLDDAPKNIDRLRAAGRFAVVFDQPYNQHMDGPRARNWDEAHDLISARMEALAERNAA